MLIKEIAQFLHNNGQGVFDETGVTGDIFIQTLPEAPDECLAIYQNGGTAADPRNIDRQPAVQIIIRSIPQDPRKTIERGQAIFNLLNGFNSSSFVSGGSYILDCTAQQSGPYSIGTDQNERHEFTINFLVQYKL